MYRENYIPFENCIHGGLYEIDARNFSFGVFNKDEKAFIGVRRKFGSRFLDQELHWDVDQRHGTAKPIKYICDCPYMDISTQNDDLFNWLSNMDIRELKYIR